MFKELFQNTPTIFPVIGFLVFFIFYLGIVIWTFTTKKEYRNRMKNLPLDAKHSTLINGEKKNG